MAMKLLAAVLAAAAPCSAIKVAFRGSLVQRSSAQADRAAYLSAEAEDRRFWLSEYDSLEQDLLSLQAAVAPTKANATANKTVPPVALAAAPSNHSAPVLAAAPANASVPEHVNMLKGIHMNLNPKSAVDLLPALAMLKGLYETGKDRISQLNVREQESKKQFETRQATHNDRMAVISARGKNHTLSAEFVANETRDENRLFNYWERVRDRQHHQFHTNLNIQHGMMQRVKTMIDAYEKAIAGAGQTGSNQFQKDLESVMGGAHLSLLEQARADARSFCNDAIAQVRTERAELSQPPHAP